MEVRDQKAVDANPKNIKNSVQNFYDQVGWQHNELGQYQNAEYEDLRPVSQEYILRCHRRILRHIRSGGKYLLDAGSGPIQYPIYLEYSAGYQFRVCADISIVALKEARQRIGEHGLFVVADIANLPFKAQVFEGIVSLHTIHHLPVDEHIKAYRELHRVLAGESKAAVVNGWKNPPLMRLLNPLVRRSQNKIKASTGVQKPKSFSDGLENLPVPKPANPVGNESENAPAPKGTFVSKYQASWLKRELGKYMPVKIYCWRSVSVPFLRAFIHPGATGRFILKIIYLVEEILPRFLGENGQYPLVVIKRINNS